jgi:hypothetical protein
LRLREKDKWEWEWEWEWEWGKDLVIAKYNASKIRVAILR